MNKQIMPQGPAKGFEDIKKLNADGVEYWEARELMPLLGYKNWRDFENAVKKAVRACQQSDQNVKYHFEHAPKMIKIAKNTAREASREVKDYKLSRYACYLIAQNGDSRKPEIATAQTYFAVQTRKQELYDELTYDQKRLLIREEVRKENKSLFKTAQNAGVTNFGKFNNAGYLGLYGMTAGRIKQKKGIGKDNIMDRAGATELAANLFRITQTDDKIEKEQIQGQPKADKTHYGVGRKVRKTIKEIGGEMPEKLPAEGHVKQLNNKRPKKIK